MSVDTWNSSIILWTKVLKLYTSSRPPLFFTCMKKLIPNIAKINMIRNSSKQMLNSAGRDMAKANRSVRMPLAPFTSRNTRPTFATRTTLSKVGDTKYFSIISLNTKPEEIEKFISYRKTSEKYCQNVASLYDRLRWERYLLSMENMTTTKSNQFHGSTK